MFSKTTINSKVSSIIMALLIMILAFPSVTVSAQTYPCNCQLRWNFLTNITYYGKVNYSNLSSSYQPTADTCINDWNNSSYNSNSNGSKVVSLSKTSFSSSNIDFITYANTWPLGSSIYALTIQQFTDSTWHRPGLLSTQFTEYTPSATCQLVKRYVKYAAILISNSSSFLSNTSQRRYVFSHEIGHALGLTHMTGTSIMNTDTNPIASNIPASKDYNCLKSDINNY